MPRELAVDERLPFEDYEQWVAPVGDTPGATSTPSSPSCPPAGTLLTATGAPRSESGLER